MDGRTAWIVLYECFGEDTVNAVKPSSLSQGNISDVADLLAAVIEAYKADNSITTALSFQSYTPPGPSGLLLKGARAVIKEGQAERYESVTQLPFYNREFHAWMQKPSFTRGIKMRECRQQMMNDLPPGWNDAAALSAVNRNIEGGANSLVFKLLKIPGF
jgi:hypothetical protein